MTHYIFSYVPEIIARPSAFLKSLKKQKGLKHAFFFVLFWFTLHYFLSNLLNFAFQLFFVTMIEDVLGSLPVSTLFDGAVTPGQTAIEFIVGLPILWLLSIGMTFVGVGILHVWTMIFGARVGYQKTYQLWAYTSLPSWLFGWLPFVGFFASIWSLVLLIYGATKVYGWSATKATLVFLLPLLLLIGLVVLIIAVFFVFFFPELVL